MGAREEDGGVNYYNVPEDSREIVQELKEILNRSELEIYAMLVECDMDADETITRLLDKEDGGVNYGNVPDESREVVEKLKEILNRSEPEIYAMLLECNMDADEAINRLLSQDDFQQVKSRRDKKKEIKDTSDSNKSQRVSLSGENKSNTDETSSVQGLTASSTASILGPIPNRLLSSDRTKVETKRVPVSHRRVDLPFIDVLKMGIGSPRESVNQAPLKDDCPLDAPSPCFNSPIDSPVTSDQLQEPASVSIENSLSDRSSNLLIDESASESNQNLRNEDSRLLCDEDINRNNETYELQRPKDPSTCVATDDPEARVKEDERVLIIPSHLQVKTAELSHLRFGRFGCGQGEDVSEFADDLSLKDMNLSDDELHKEEEQQRLGSNVANSAQYETHEAFQENQYKIPSSTDFTFDNGQWLNPVDSPSETSLGMQKVDAMHQQAYTRELDPHYSAFPYNHSIPTASSHVSMPSISMGTRSECAFEPRMNQQGRNHHYSHLNISSEHYDSAVNYPHSQPAWIGGNNTNTYHHQLLDEPCRRGQLAGGVSALSGITAKSQPEVPSGNYGNTLKFHHTKAARIDTLLSAYQQSGVSNKDTYQRQSLAAMIPQNRNSDLPRSAFTPAYGSPSYANGFGMSSANIANSRLGYENVLSSQFDRSNHLPTIQHQNSNVQSRNDYYSLLSGRQNQHSPSLRQQEEQSYGELDYGRSSLYNAHMRQLNGRRRDSSNQTKQHPWQSYNYY